MSLNFCFCWFCREVPVRGLIKSCKVCFEHSDILLLLFSCFVGNLILVAAKPCLFSVLCVRRNAPCCTLTVGFYVGRWSAHIDENGIGDGNEAGGV